MDLQDLQQNWGAQGAQNNLVIQLFKESRQSKISDNLKKTHYTASYLCCLT